MRRGQRQRPAECPVPQCARPRERWQAVCPSCFRRLPSDLRSRFDAARAARAPHRISAVTIDAIRWLGDHAPAVAISRVIGERPG